MTFYVLNPFGFNRSQNEIFKKDVAPFLIYHPISFKRFHLRSLLNASFAYSARTYTEMSKCVGIKREKQKINLNHAVTIDHRNPIILVASATIFCCFTSQCVTYARRYKWVTDYSSTSQLQPHLYSTGTTKKRRDGWGGRRHTLSSGEAKAKQLCNFGSNPNC